MARFSRQRLGSISTTVQVIGVVIGFVISILSFNDARKKEAEARGLETIKPFMELRQEVYKKAVAAAAVLVNSSVHTADEYQTAKKQFRDLYVAQLSMVECREVAKKMVALAGKIDRELLQMSDAQQAAYDLSQALRKSYTRPVKNLVPPCPEDQVNGAD
jgi:uncharacterized membrane-anchored protein YhcB (DUF1043 family)